MKLTKGDKTRTALLNTARDLFAEKGFAQVTMQDICDRQKISRGGLYRYFSSTKAVFTAMLDAEKEQSSSELDAALAAGISARQLFSYFLTTQKREVQQQGGRLSIAVYAFSSQHPEEKHYLNQRFEAAVAMLEKLIRYGQARNEFFDGDAAGTARHIVLFLEGFKISSAVLSLPEASIDQQLQYLYKLVVIPEPASA